VIATITLGYDCGQGNGKGVGPHGGAMLERYASIARPERVRIQPKLSLHQGVDADLIA
jgi:hypothetical protein